MTAHLSLCALESNDQVDLETDVDTWQRAGDVGPRVTRRCIRSTLLAMAPAELKQLIIDGYFSGRLTLAEAVLLIRFHRLEAA